MNPEPNFSAEEIQKLRGEVASLSPRQHVAYMAQQYKLLWLGTSAALPLFFMPGAPLAEILNTLIMGGAPGEDTPMQLRHGHEPDAYVVSQREVLDRLSNAGRSGALSVDVLSAWMVLAAIRIGDAITERNLRDSGEPLLEFARHFRNACAHGDQWHFVGGEPRYPARCRDLEVTTALQGSRATYTTVSPRRFVEFLDDISNHFNPGSQPPPVAT